MSDRKNKTGKVWLVGAGPGDMGLLTEKGRAVLEGADTIVYDALVSLELLSSLPEGAEYINVGKRSSHHPVPQEEINAILLEKAREGKKVVRLKGGDPFVFGRGGEELELLAGKGIPFEVVPGITSAVAVPAYNGIPVTHRDYTSSFHVITGHRKKDGALDIDFEALVRLKATLVFLMGLSELPVICRRLMEAGMASDMPSAVLQKGTTWGQKRVIAPLKDLEAEATGAGIESPAIIVVGEVCHLEKDFAWFEKKPLFGRQILVTRPRMKESVLAGRLRELGAQVIEYPTIETRPVPDFSGSVREMLKESRPVCLTFTSPRGVAYFFEQLKKMSLDLRGLFAGPELTFAVLGKGTAAALAEHGIYADLMPDRYSAADLGRLLAEKWDRTGIVYLFRARRGSKELNAILEESGIPCRDIPTYDTLFRKEGPMAERIGQALEAGEIDKVCFTSASTVEGFAGAFPEADKTKVKALCIGQQTGEAAKKLGMKVTISSEATIDSMISALLEERELSDKSEMKV